MRLLDEFCFSREFVVVFLFAFAFLIFRLFDIYLTYIIYTLPPIQVCVKMEMVFQLALQSIQDNKLYKTSKEIQE